MAAANAATEEALRYSDALKIRFLPRDSLPRPDSGLARDRSPRRWPERCQRSRSQVKVIEGNLALNNGDAPLAVKLLTESTAILDTWIARFDLGRANLAALQLLQADSEFDRCIKRQGEALSLFLDEEPTYGYFPLVLYYKGRVREELKSTGFVDSYRVYLTIRDKAGEDPLLPEIRKRAGLVK